MRLRRCRRWRGCATRRRLESLYVSTAQKTRRRSESLHVSTAQKTRRNTANAIESGAPTTQTRHANGQQPTRRGDERYNTGRDAGVILKSTESHLGSSTPCASHHVLAVACSASVHSTSAIVLGKRAGRADFSTRTLTTATHAKRRTGDSQEKECVVCCALYATRRLGTWRNTASRTHPPCSPPTSPATSVLPFRHRRLTNE